MSARVAVDWKGLGAVVLADAGVTRDARGVVAVPYRYADGRVAKRKLITPNGGTWWDPIGVEQIPLGLETLAQGEARADRALVIAEGESDTLAIREALAEDYDGKRVTVLGLPGAGSWRSDWARHVHGHARAYVVGDGDAAGAMMMRRVCESVPWVRPVRLPAGEDARSVLQRRGPRGLDPYIEAANADIVLLAALRLAPTLERFEQILREVEW